MKSICIVALPFFLSSLAAIGGDRSWEQYGAGPEGLRYSPHNEITPQNWSKLERAWQFRSTDVSAGENGTGRSSFKATPIYFESMLYVISGFNRVYALDPATGAPRWQFDPVVDFSVEYSEMFTARGIASWRNGSAEGICRHRLFVGTLDARLIAIDATTGLRCSGFGRHGEVDLSHGIENFRRGQYSLTSPVAVVNDTVVVGSSIGDNGSVTLERGIVRGYGARDGDLRWTWDPIPREPGDQGYDHWAPKAAARTGAANVWSAMAADPVANLVYLPTTSPSPDFYGGERPGDNRFANSLVALDATNGRMQWFFQTVHHDLWDFDLASQPSLSTAGANRTAAVVLATKMGHVFVLDRHTGAPIFGVEERPVPRSDVPGEDAAPTQPYPLYPAPLHPESIVPEDIWEVTPEHATQCRAMLGRYRYAGPFTPPSLEGTIMYPGNAGGTNWGSTAVDPQRNIAVMAINRMPTVVALIPRAEFKARKIASEAAGQARQFTAQSGTPYGMMRFPMLVDGKPCLKGPWGTVVAIDLGRGKKLWEKPLGTYPQFADHPTARHWGTLLKGGPMVSASGLVAMATEADPKIHAIETDSGRYLGAHELPAGAHATPMSYRHLGRQYVVVAAGGQQSDSEQPGDFVVAFSLPGHGPGVGQ